VTEQSLFERMKDLLRHTAIYGLGNLVARIVSVLLLPLYTRYLTPADYGLIETLVALAAVLTALVSQAMKSAFFRFYFDSAEDDRRRRVVLTAFWYVMAAATAVLALGVALAGPISTFLFGDDSHAGLVIAAFVGLWAAMNYEQMTSMFRVEKRSGAYLNATLANLVFTVTATILLVVVFEQGPLGVIVGNFTGTLIVYAALLVHRRGVLGFGFDRQLYRSMVHYGLPLVPSVLALWVTNFSDRFFLVKLADVEEVGLYSIGARLASAIVIGLTAFRLGWPAFAYSIEDDREAKRTYSFVMTYVIYMTCWAALALGVLAPWLLQLITTEPFYAAENVVAPLAFATAAFGGYAVALISVGRVRATRLNWAVTGVAAGLNVALNLLLIPDFGRMGAAFATLAAYSLMFGAMVWRAQTVFPVPYQWRRLATVVVVAVGLTVLAKAADVPLAVALLLVAAYPLALIPLRFYLPAERARLRSLLPT
jgi:O-antigen/teichoic acid export membrane protein